LLKHPFGGATGKKLKPKKGHFIENEKKFQNFYP